MKKIKIMYLISSLGSGGAEKHVVELANNIDKTRYHVFIVIYHDNIHFKHILDVEGVSVVCIKKKFKLSLLFLWKLVKFIKRNKIDIIHSHMHNTNVWARLAGKISGCKIVISSIHSTNVSSIYYLIENILKNWTTRVIAVSHITKQKYLENISVSNTNFVTVIQNGIDLDMIANIPKISAEELRLKYNLQKDDFVVIHVAGIDRNKNQRCLLKAVKSSNIEKLKILFVGLIRDYGYYQELQNYVKSQNLEKSVIFLGEQQQQVVFSIFGISDLFVLTSLYEAFPTVIMEAMSAGLPIISSDAGDVKYLVRDGINGFLFPRDDHQRLAELIVKMYSLSIDERKEMGKAGRNIIEENYTIEKMVKEIEAIYEAFIKKWR